MFGADDKLSRAASAIWKARTFEDPLDALGRGADCGSLIDKAARAHELRILEKLGFTPGSYNEMLRERLAPEYPRMSYRTYIFLGMLEVEACPVCGGPIESKTMPTRNYGGGFDTYLSCTHCDYQEVYV